MAIKNTRDQIARDCVNAALQLFLRRDRHALVEFDAKYYDQIRPRAMMYRVSVRESLASAVRAIEGLPHAMRIQLFYSAAHSHEHLTGVEHQLRRELEQDGAGFEQALDEQWDVLRQDRINVLQQDGYQFEPVTDVPPPRRG